jgi:hypothetical protein
MSMPRKDVSETPIAAKNTNECLRAPVKVKTKKTRREEKA